MITRMLLFSMKIKDQLIKVDNNLFQQVINEAANIYENRMQNIELDVRDFQQNYS